MKSLKYMMVVLSVAWLFAGCSDSSSPSDGGKGDTTPPTIASVTAVDQNHVDIEFSETVTKETAEDTDNYSIVEGAIPAPAAAPGDPLPVGTVGLDGDGMTVHITTSSQMQNIQYDLTVRDIRDASGNVIQEGTSQTFDGTTSSDVTPPTIISRSPTSGEAGVGVGKVVIVQFSEPMQYSTVQSAFGWTSGGGPVAYHMETEEWTNTYLFVPDSPLENGTVYTVSVNTSAQDWGNNHLASTSTWNFTTTSQVDNTPPTLASSTPPSGSTNVSLGTNLSLTFSEPVDRYSLQEVFLFPDVGGGTETWSNGDRTITFDPDTDLMQNTQYQLLIAPNGVRDLAGNGNTSVIEVVWTTGTSLETGGFSGTISGPNSADATGPGGAIVIAADLFPFGDNENFAIIGSAVVAGNGSYAIHNLPDGTYFPACVLDSNDDGEIDPGYGDALGAYGVDIEQMIFEPDSVIVSGSVVTGIDFPLYDPSAIVGHVSYVGSAYTEGYPFLVAVFDTTGFDINNLGEPAFGAEGYWPGDTEYRILTIDQGLTDGTYYVGAFLDVNGNTSPDPGEPANFHGGLPPTPVTVENGSDAFDVDIILDDGAGLTAGGSWVRGDRSRRTALLRRLSAVVREATRR
jgi:hypothetical protein